MWRRSGSQQPSIARVSFALGGHFFIPAINAYEFQLVVLASTGPLTFTLLRTSTALPRSLVCADPIPLAWFELRTFFQF